MRNDVSLFITYRKCWGWWAMIFSADIGFKDKLDLKHQLTDPLKQSRTILKRSVNSKTYCRLLCWLASTDILRSDNTGMGLVELKTCLTVDKVLGKFQGFRIAVDRILTPAALLWNCTGRQKSVPIANIYIQYIYMSKSLCCKSETCSLLICSYVNKPTSYILAGDHHCPSKHTHSWINSLCEIKASLKELCDRWITGE